MVLVHSCPRAVALYCLLTQAGYSLHRKLRFPALCALLSASQTESSLMVPVHSCPRAVALYCLLTQAGHSLHRKLRFPALCALLSASQTESSLMVPVHSCPRAVALYCLLTQAGHSLMACEKQMSALAAACFSLRSLYLTARNCYLSMYFPL